MLHVHSCVSCAIYGKNMIEGALTKQLPEATDSSKSSSLQLPPRPSSFLCSAMLAGLPDEHDNLLQKWTVFYGTFGSAKHRI